MSKTKEQRKHTPRRAWNSGTSKGWTDRRGYRWIYVFENGKRIAKREHRHVVEQSLGRKLEPEELVHHKNGDHSDNRIENLEVSNWAEHTIEHHKGSRRSDTQKERMEVLATYREEHKRLKALNAELLEASRDAYALLAAIRADGYSGDCLPQLDEMLDGDDKEDSSLTKAIAKAEGRD